MEDVDAAMASIRDRGFINYFGTSRCCLHCDRLTDTFFQECSASERPQCPLT
jgi:hypothetical protein